MGVCTAAFTAVLVRAAAGQDMPEPLSSGPPETLSEALPLDPAKRIALQQIIGRRDYASAENLLSEEAKRNPTSKALLQALAHVLFLDKKQAGCALVLN